MTHRGGTLPCQRESRFQTDISDSHIIANPLNYKPNVFWLLLIFLEHRFIRPNIHTTDGTTAGQLAYADAKREHHTRAGSAYRPHWYVPNCLTINFAALSHSTYAQFARTHGRTPLSLPSTKEHYLGDFFSTDFDAVSFSPAPSIDWPAAVSYSTNWMVCLYGYEKAWQTFRRTVSKLRFQIQGKVETEREKRIQYIWYTTVFGLLAKQ